MKKRFLWRRKGCRFEALKRAPKRGGFELPGGAQGRSKLDPIFEAFFLIRDAVPESRKNCFFIIYTLFFLRLLLNGPAKVHSGQGSIVIIGSQFWGWFGGSLGQVWRGERESSLAHLF